MKRTILEFAMHSRPLDWQKAADQWKAGPGFDHFPAVDNRPTMDEAISELDATIQGLTRLRGYLDARYGHGCGDQGHTDAVKEANRLTTKVRKALGYTYPKCEVSF